MPDTFTVLGYYEDNRQPWATSVTVDHPEDADEAARQDMVSEFVDADDIVVVGCVRGQHEVFGGDHEHGI